MDDLDRAILVIYDPSAADPSLRSQALAYCDQAKSDPAAALRLSLSRLSSSPSIPVQFWCLQSLHDLLRLRFPSLPAADLPLLRSSLLSGLPPSSPPFLKNKLAQTLAALVALEYPHNFPSPFLHLLRLLPASADLLLRLLAALDDDLISQDYPRSPDESAAATRVKDAIRAECAPQLAGALFDIARSNDPALAAQALDVTRRYVAWMDINLVANDYFVPLLFELALSPATPDQLRSAAALCLLAVVNKRMDFRSKLSLLRSLQLSRIFANPELVPKLAPLITGYASEALLCYFKLSSSGADGFSSMELVEEALPSVFNVIQNCEDVDSGNVVEFLSEYVSTMKSLSQKPSEKQLIFLGQILEVIRSQMCYDSAYRANLDIPDKIGKEEEDQMGEHRKELFTLYRSVCRVAPDATQLFIRNLLANALTSLEMNVEEVEVAISLFYRFGETVGDEQMRTGSGLLGELVQMLLSARFPCHSHRIVALVYLETITRYLKFVQENARYIPLALAAFLDERGVHHTNISVSRRASYLFMRAVKLMKAQLLPFIDTILQNLQDTIARFTNLDWASKGLKCSSSEDGSQTFEAIGYLIGMEEVSPEKQSEYLAALINPLCRQVESLISDAKVQDLDESSARVVSLQQIIMALNALSKGFNERLVTSTRPVIGCMFKQTLDVHLQVLVMFPNIRPLRTKITSFLHRMVDILGVSILPYLPLALNQLLSGSEPKDMEDFLVLINQVICKFNTSATGILEDIFPTVASRLFHFLSSDAFPTGPGCNTEEIRELQDLQRTLYTFLHAMVTHDLSSVLIAPNSRGYFDATIQLLLMNSCSHKDINLRKMCVQIFIKLIKDWGTKNISEDKVGGFRSFIFEKFATNCCLYSMLDKSFDFRDANTVVLFGEIVLAHKVMYEKFGDEFITHFKSNCLPSAHCPQQLANLYSLNLKCKDIKVFKTFYQSLIENLRQQQNGSLVFR